MPIFKNKGSRGQCDNYRGISLLSAASKVIGKAILTHIERVVECQLSESQCGFRRGRSCADQIFAIRTVMEKSWEFRRLLYMTFIDLRKAYDSVNRMLRGTSSSMDMAFQRSSSRSFEHFTLTHMPL